MFPTAGEFDRDCTASSASKRELFEPIRGMPDSELRTDRPSPEPHSELPSFPCAASNASKSDCAELLRGMIAACCEPETDWAASSWSKSESEEELRGIILRACPPDVLPSLCSDRSSSKRAFEELLRGISDSGLGLESCIDVDSAPVGFGDVSRSPTLAEVSTSAVLRFEAVDEEEDEDREKPLVGDLSDLMRLSLCVTLCRNACCW